MKLSKAYMWLFAGALLFALGCEVNVNDDGDDAGASGGGGGDPVAGGVAGFGGGVGNAGSGGGDTPVAGGGGETPAGGGGTPPAGGGGEPDDPCDLGDARNIGAPCSGPSDCGDGGVCTANGAQAVCYAKCIPGECSNMCSGNQTCVPLTDASGAAVQENGKPIGFCAAEETGNNCVTVMECIFECEDSACAQACYADGTPTAAAEANELIACIQANYDLCETDACFEDACSEYWHCMPEGGGGGGGTEDCRTSWFCILECDNEDATCQQDCVNNATPDAYSQLMDVFDCAQTAPGETWHSVADYCAEEWGACDLPEIGNGGCSDFFNCFVECADNRCAIECMLSSSEEAIDQYNAMIDCADQAGILDNPQATFGDIAEGCPDEWAACGLEPIEFGDATCNDVVTCMDDCDLTNEETAQACVGECQGQGSADAITAYNAAIQCILDNNCNADAQNASGLFNAEGCATCADVIDACMAP